LVAELQKNKDLTGEEVGRLLGCSARTGRRLLRKAEDLLASETNERDREAG
jgi:MarR-like DNA-binding transcriptional regulator SgrR of sgrS sRNA